MDIELKSTGYSFFDLLSQLMPTAYPLRYFSSPYETQPAPLTDQSLMQRWGVTASVEEQTRILPPPAYGIALDTPRLLIQWLVLIVVAGLALLMTPWSGRP